MDVAIIADDLTGASDTGVQLVRAGYRTAVAFRGAATPPDGDLDALALDTDSRTAPVALAVRRVAQAASTVSNVRVVYKKIDSTLRGPVAAELAAALEATGRERAILAPAFPSAGRTTEDGVQFVHGVPAHETEAKNDPHTPVREAHLPTMIAATLPGVVSLSAEQAADPDAVGRALGDARCVVADAASDEDLEALVRAVPDPASVLWVGSAGLAKAFGTVYPGPHADEPPAERAPVRRVLVVVGSLSGVAREQLRRLVDEYGDVAVPVDPGEEGAAARAGAAAREALLAAGCVVVHSPEKRSKPGSGPAVMTLAEVAGALDEGGLFDALVLTGGSTAVVVARRLGASGILLAGEVESGVPMGTLVGPRPYPVVTKAGAFGGADTLVEAVKSLSESGRG